MGAVFNTITCLEDSKPIQGTSKKFKFGQYAIQENDHNNFYAKNEINHYNKEQFDNKNKTLYMIEQLGYYEHDPSLDYLQDLNTHISTKREWYQSVQVFHTNAYQQVLNYIKKSNDEASSLSECFSQYIEHNKSGLMPQQIMREMSEIHRLSKLLYLVERRPIGFENDIHLLIKELFKDDRDLIRLLNENAPKGIIRAIRKYTPFTTCLYYYNCWQQEGQIRFKNNKDTLTLDQSLLDIPCKQIIDFGEEDGPQLDNTLFKPNIDYIKLFVPGYQFQVDVSKVVRFVLYEEPREEQIQRQKAQKKEYNKKYYESQKAKNM